MKNIIPVIILIVFTRPYGAAAQCIPDINFRQAIIAICPDCIDINGCLLPEAKNLNDLNVSNKNIADLTGVEGFTGLESLYCNNNNLTSIADLPDSLELLYCSNNQLTSLPSILPIKLVQLKCEDNKLSALPALPNSMKILFCSDNLLTDLPPLPNSLDNLTCNDNFLFTLPPLPKELTSIHANLNQLYQLPELPQGLKKLYCEQNQLLSLPALPASLKTLEISGNPIACLPELPFDIEDIGYNFTNISCLPNLPAIFQVFAPLPLCINGQGSNCALNPVISGKVYVDFDGDGTEDVNDIPFPGIAVKANIENWAGYTGISGSYKMSAGFSNSYSINVIPPTGNYTVIPSTPYTVSFNDTTAQYVENIDFGIHPDPDLRDLSVSLTSGQMISGGKCAYYLTYTNQSPYAIDGSVTLQFDPQISFIGSDVPPFVQTGTLLTWTYAGLAPFESQTISTKFDVPTTVIAGSELVFSTLGVINGFSDIDPDDNAVIDTVLVVGAPISNYKSVDKTSILPTVLIGGNEEIEYTLFFQNNGTSAAQHFDLYDTLSNNLIGSSFEVLGASHDGDLTITNVTSNPSHPLVLHWSFADIKLPTILNDPLGSRGFVKFKVKPLATLTQGSKILNKGIYQFSNAVAPVFTNTVTTNIMFPVSATVVQSENTQLEVFPNPFTEQVSVRLTRPQAQTVTLCIITVFGQVIWEKTYSGSEEKTIDVDLPEIPKGTYLLRLTDHTSQYITKMIRQ